MHKVWYKQLELDCLNFEETWNNIYITRIRKMPFKKIADSYRHTTMW